MARFKVKVRRVFEESGYLIVEADDKDEAKDSALGSVIDGDGRVRWDTAKPMEYFVDEVSDGK